MKNQKSFTFIEVLVVIGIISLLATIAVVTINPARRFEAARDKQREIHLQAILTAIYQYRITTGSDCPNMPDDTELKEVDGEEKEVPVFKIIGTGKEKPNPEKYYNLYSCLVPIYLAEPLYDPIEGSEADTIYKIWQNPYSKRVTLLYEKGEKKIVAGPKDYWILEEPTVETIKPVDPQNIAHTWAVVEGDVTDDGGARVWERGFLWTKNTGELTFNAMDGYVTSSSGTGDFFGTITGLTHDITYHFRAYAKNDIGVGYGDIVDFTTPDLRPTVRTLEAEDVTVDRATLLGEVTSLGGATYAEVYFKWSEGNASLDRMTDGNRPSVGTAEKFSYILTGLTYVDEDNPVYYYFQACAWNDVKGERCGNILSFKTGAGVPIVETIIDVSSISSDSARLGGKIIHDGGLQVGEYGICFDTTMTPTYCIKAETQVEKGFTFFWLIEDLVPGAKYWIFAYAKNAKGTGYGDTMSFSTKVTAPTLSETIIRSDGTNSAELGGFIISDGGAPITSHGVCWADYPEEPGFHLLHQCEVVSGGQVGEFTFKMKNFLVGTRYNVKAFAINNKNLGGWSPTEDFTPSQFNRPALVTESVDIKGLSTTTVFNGTIKNNGGANLEKLGFCWGVDNRPERPNPRGGGCVDVVYLPEIKVVRDEIDFEFSATVEDLPRSTDYYALALAKNDKYAEDGLGLPAKSFRTPPGLPAEVETGSVSNIEGRKATVSGEIKSTGGDSSTIAGICYASAPTIPTFPSSENSKCQILWTGGELGGFSWRLDELMGGSTYNYVAFAQNNHETKPLVYGDVKNFIAGSAQGADCTEKEECVSRHCADNVCCNSDCSQGDCRSCKEPNRGTCTLAKLGDDPRGDCTEETSWTSCLNTCQAGRRADYCGEKTGECYIIPGNIAEGYVCIGAGNQIPIETAVKEQGIYCEIDNHCKPGDCTGFRYYTSCKGDGTCWRAVEAYKQAYKETRYGDRDSSLTEDCDTNGYLNCGLSEDFSVCLGLCNGTKNTLYCDGSGGCNRPSGSQNVAVKPNYICKNGKEIPDTCDVDGCMWCQGGTCQSKFYDPRNIPFIIPTAKINNQCWMTQNMNVGARVDGLLDQNTSCDVNIKKYCYGDDSNNCTSNNPTHPDGGLYQWNQAMCGLTTERAQGICPAGWHIPNNDEWSTFEANLAGHRNTTGSFDGRGAYTGLWSSTQYTNETAWYRSLYNNDPSVYNLLFDKIGGFSVRCIKN